MHNIYCSFICDSENLKHTNMNTKWLLVCNIVQLTIEYSDKSNLENI